jgi:hypothetical protein
MRTRLLLVAALVLASGFLLSIPSSDAHYWVPVYNGVKWAQSCRAGGVSRVTAATCCEHGASFCKGACNLADIGDGWKNQCRANCESARLTCLANVTPPPPVTGVVPGQRPPATTN